MAKSKEDRLPLPPGMRKRKRVRPLEGKGPKAQQRKASWYRHFIKVITSEHAILSILAVLIGVLAAIGAYIFRTMIQVFKFYFMGTTDITAMNWTELPYGLLTVFSPIIGGLIVGLLVYYFAPELKGLGVPDVMEAVYEKGGKIRPRLIAVKTLTSSISLGSGASLGREGPIVHIGSAIGSLVGQRFKLPDGWTKILVGCGAAAAVSASFNTPIAGVIFALELVLMELKTRSFIPLVVSSVFATLLSRRMFGDRPTFDLTEGLLSTYVLKSPWELLLYLLLGFLAGLVAVAFIKIFYSFTDIFNKWNVKSFVKPVLGGAVIGLICLLFPQLFGVGYETVDAVLKGNLPFTGSNLVTFLGLLVILKMIATSISGSSGLSGGVFSPSLFIGAMLGGAIGTLGNMYFPDMTGPAGAYAVVGMAAIFAGVSRATFTSMIIIFEMTLDYHLILPVMFACVVSDAVSSVLTKDTIYTTKLRRKGVRIVHDMEVNLLEALTVRDAMVKCRDVVCIEEDLSIGEVYSTILKTEHMGFPVVNRTGKCCGMITFHDVDKAMSNGYIAEPVRWFCTRRPIVCYRTESLETCLQKMRRHDISHLPVVSREDKKKLRGFITKGDILRTYARKHMREKGKRGRIL